MIHLLEQVPEVAQVHLPWFSHRSSPRRDRGAAAARPEVYLFLVRSLRPNRGRRRIRSVVAGHVAGGFGRTRQYQGHPKTGQSDLIGWVGRFGMVWVFNTLPLLVEVERSKLV